MDLKNNNIDLKKFPWIFWLHISFYNPKKWFTPFWSTRGSNHYQLKCYCIEISIGRPWIEDVLKRQLEFDNKLTSAKNTNNSNLNARFSIRIGNYKKFKDLL